jgi:DNA-directed RNA polymerase subunit RPC12/RpoP
VTARQKNCRAVPPEEEALVVVECLECGNQLGVSNYHIAHVGELEIDCPCCGKHLIITSDPEPL